MSLSAYGYDAYPGATDFGTLARLDDTLTRRVGMGTLVTSCDGDTLTILVQGDLSFNDHWDFRACFAQVPLGVTRYVVDFRAATQVDGSALGMFLLLQDHAGGDRQRVQLRHVSSSVREVFRDANFEALFLLA